jgi:hypothetical protein
MKKSLFVFIYFFISRCTYSFTPPLPSGIKNIGVESFENVTERPGIEGIVTQSFIDGILRDKRIPLRDPESCDILLKGKIINYKRMPYGIRGGGDVYSYKVLIRAKIKFLKGEKEIFKEREFEGIAIYDVRESSEEEAIENASRDLARKVIEFIYAQAI